MFKDFRDFLLRGNVLDLAVAVVMGTAFSAIVNSLVNDILMPLLGILTGSVNFANLTVKVYTATVAYGKFVQATVEFILIALGVYLIIKIIQATEARFQKEKEEQQEAAPPEDIQLLRQIRDLLQQQVE